MSLTSVTIISPEAANGRNVVALGVTKAFAAAKKTAVFRPAVCRKETFTDVLLEASNSGLSREQSVGVCPKRARTDKEGSRADIVAAYTEAIETAQPEAVVVVGTDKSAINDPSIFAFNADVAADLKSVVLLAVCTINRTPEQVLGTVEASKTIIENAGSKVAGVFITGCKDEQVEPLKEEFAAYEVPVWTLPAVDFDEEDAVTKATEAFEANVNAEELISAVEAPFKAPTTPYAFQYSLLGKAKADKRTIVLPEGTEDRIIKAADYLLERDIVDLIIVGDKESILARGEELGLKFLEKAQFQAKDDEEVLAPMVAKLCELRAKKGMTEEQARKQLTDASYFGTMLVVLGYADGLVSGAVNSTANTVRPALQVIKTKPGQRLVSGAFLMCFKDHVTVFSDCAINLNPDAEQLAEIALQSAVTAKAFGIEPKVGMLSYSTLGSGKGEDVDKMRNACEKAKALMPDTPIGGEFQFDAAVSPAVAKTKHITDAVGGHANTFIFPDINAGNIGYKIAQRLGSFDAYGPILLGLNAPINDLSRGCNAQEVYSMAIITAGLCQD